MSFDSIQLYKSPYYLRFVSLITEHKICIVGLDNAGKTTILYQFLMNEVVQTSPTIGSNVEVNNVTFYHTFIFDILELSLECHNIDKS